MYVCDLHSFLCNYPFLRGKQNYVKQFQRFKVAADAADKIATALYKQRVQFDSLRWRVHYEIILCNMRVPMQIFIDVFIDVFISVPDTVSVCFDRLRMVNRYVSFLLELLVSIIRFDP